MSDVTEVRQAVLDACRQLIPMGLVSGTAGNISGRIDEGTVAMSPSSLPYDEMTLADIVVVELDGTVVEGERAPTSEKDLHLAVMAAHPEVKGVVHCHAQWASTFAVARVPIPAGIDEFVIYVGGNVPVCDYHPSGSASLGAEVASKLFDRSAALMANHGLVAIGKSVPDAMHTAATVEHNAQIMHGALALGGVVPLSEDAHKNFRGVYELVRGHMW